MENKNLPLLQELLISKKNGEISRLGKLFNTDQTRYFYDTGTGKVIQLDEDSSAFFDILFDINVDYRNIDENFFRGQFTDNRLDYILEFIEKENILQAVKPKRLYSTRHYEGLERSVKHEVEQIILELTGKCNMRCKYCIYNDEYIYNRSFNSFDMSKEIAKASVDYLKKHGKKEGTKSVTFYGGEPLMNFNLLKWTIEYARSVFSPDELSFSFTTNLTLVTPRIADYLGTIPNLHLVGSLDGPEEVQNSYRVFSNGNGTFEKAMHGLELLCNAIKDNPSATLMINGVYTPPYSMEKITAINNFFMNLDILPDDCSIQFTYPAEGSVNEDEFVNEDSDQNTLWRWIEAISWRGNSKEKQLYTGTMMRSLVNVHNRYLTEKAIDIYPFNSCCVPGARRLYVATDGELYICEKMGSSPSIGNILSGLDMEKLKKNYIEDFNNQSLDVCSKCWAIRMCPFCYSGRYTEDGFSKEFNFESCSSARKGVQDQLALYYSILERHPEKLVEIANIETR